MVILTTLQRLWLNSRGGRDESDVFVDSNNDLYIEMLSNHRLEKIIIPTDNRIRKEYHIGTSRSAPRLSILLRRNKLKR